MTDKDKTKKDLEEFKAKRKHQRKIANALLREWIIKTGTGHLINKYIEKRGIEEYGYEEGWNRMEPIPETRPNPENKQYKKLVEYIENNDR